MLLYVLGDQVGEVRAVSGMHEGKGEQLARFVDAFIALLGTNTILPQVKEISEYNSSTSVLTFS